jgi:hypothetical protein
MALKIHAAADLPEIGYRSRQAPGSPWTWWTKYFEQWSGIEAMIASSNYFSIYLYKKPDCDLVKNSFFFWKDKLLFSTEYLNCDCKQKIIRIINYNLL